MELIGIPSETPKHRRNSQEVAAAAPGKQGEVLIKLGGARRDLDLLTLEGVASRLEKWLSMLAASVRQAHRVLPFALEEPRRTGVPQLGAALTDELLAAAALLDTTQKQPGDGEEVKAAMQLLLQEDLPGHFQRTAASLYICRWRKAQHRGVLRRIPHGKKQGDAR